MERSTMSEAATRSVSTVATDQVGVSASDRISPVPPAAPAPWPSPPAIFLPLYFVPHARNQSSSTQGRRTDGRIAAAEEAAAEESRRGLGLKRRFFRWPAGGGRDRYAAHGVGISATIVSGTE